MQIRSGPFRYHYGRKCLEAGPPNNRPLARAIERVVKTQGGFTRTAVSSSKIERGVDRQDELTLEFLAHAGNNFAALRAVLEDARCQLAQIDVAQPIDRRRQAVADLDVILSRALAWSAFPPRDPGAVASSDKPS